MKHTLTNSRYLDNLLILAKWKMCNPMDELCVGQPKKWANAFGGLKPLLVSTLILL
jgi:hypothetical protein